jgi:hypothetical protein
MLLGSDGAEPLPRESDTVGLAPKGSGEAEPASLGSVEAGLSLWLVGTKFHAEGLAKFVITFLICQKASS